MQPHPGADLGGGLPPAPAASRWRGHALRILWPAFVMAGVLEMLVFAVVDPGSLHGMGDAPLDWPPIAVHSVAFFVFWGVISAAAAATLLLDDPRRRGQPPV